LPSWIRIRIPNTDPDPGFQLNTDPIRIRIHNPVAILPENQIIFTFHVDADPDPPL
jgi:hypothetical protein